MAFTPVPWALLIGSRPGTPPLRRRIGSRGPCRWVRPEGRTQRLDSSRGVHRGPFASMTVSASTPIWTVAQTSARDCHVPDSFRSCRSSRLQRFPPQRPDPKVGPSTACGFVAPRSRPWGSPCFQLPSTLRWRDPKVAREAFPSSEDPSKRFPLRQPDHLVTAPPPRGFGCVHRVACPLVVGCRRVRVATDPPAPRPQGFVPPKSPLRSESVATFRSLDAPMGFWSNTSRCLPRVKRWTEKFSPFPCGSNSVQGSRISREGWGRQSLGFVWLRAGRCWHRPESR